MNESIGAALRSGREQRRLTLAQVSDATKVRSHYLQALENDDLSSMPSAAQARGFLRIYAEFLGLDADSLISAATATPEAATSETSSAPAAAQPVPPIAAVMPAKDARAASPAATPESRQGPPLVDRLVQLLERVVARLAEIRARAGNSGSPKADSAAQTKKKAPN